ncbi:TIM barrel protein [Nonomuraea phyllanthi]|uniref:TIM barrel protein n=1 Tax=Nonomuraea phyllanthi TaxID=2219224 RepID=A0A5C4VB69_9ACTN|nr:TIM barrel protein [Nonomuraea phyllanthi]KAB8191197.1 TIM barrel protein [Nonomuraea phyllanthi]QFY12743.1 TIM barrel protein [Nonomuraea phyllanthi]
MKLAGAPISWGVCEVPDWGHQLDPERVLSEMRELGLTATELGPQGFLTPALIERYGLRLVGAFVPVVLHDPGHDPLPGLPDEGTLVLAAATGADGYDVRPELDATGWATLLANLDRIAAELGPRASLHPHVGTMIETRAEVERVIEGSSMPLCLDTGHLLIGGTDPADLVKSVPTRIAHVHLKDVDARLASLVTSGRMTYTQAVREGVYRPLGEGDVDIAGIVGGLDRSGYDGWYVMEQDVILSGPEDRPIENVRRSLAFLDGALG